MIYEKFELVVLPFPFSDSLDQKKRPALVVSANSFNSTAKHIVVGMVTTAKRSQWPLDIAISDLDAAGLAVPCIVRMKFFTADHRLILRKLGRLSPEDQQRVQSGLSELFAI